MYVDSEAQSGSSMRFRPSYVALAQVIVLPQPRPSEPDVLTVCACDFRDNFWLHLVSAGFVARARAVFVRSG